nr:sodium- and chloride-dependent GABA transporter ine-like isoform X2 [Procambarus clarkii]
MATTMVAGDDSSPTLNTATTTSCSDLKMNCTGGNDEMDGVCSPEQVLGEPAACVVSCVEHGGGDSLHEGAQVEYDEHSLASQDRGWQDDPRRSKGLEARQTWGNKAQFVLACVGSAVGLGNLWRFPYLCYKSGGGAFLIPYFIMLFICGIPLLLMELTVGQYTRRGPVAALEKICPLFKGAGVGSVVISFMLCTYYNVIIAWAIFYLVQSFYAELPWSNCNSTWAVNCFDDYGPGVEAPNGTKSATEEFFDEVVLQKSDGINEMGSMRIELLVALFLAWLLVYFSLWKSVKSSGRVVYVTATVPYLLIGAFLWRALTLPGANKGLQYFFGPRWELLLKAQVWVNAAAQNFNSIGIAFGSMIAFSSYNKFNNNIVVDTWIISLVNAFTSLLAGMIVFSTLGNIALEQGKEIDDVVAEGPGLVFMVYPQALAKMPYANLWAILFFMMLLILGLDSQFATVEVIITSLQDGFPKWIQKYLRHHEVLVLVVCLVSFFFGLPNVMQGGIYFFQLIDYYAAAVSLMYLAFFEVAAIVWFYGADRLARNVREMTGRLPSRYFRFCWYFAAPMLILAIWIFSMVDYKRPTYNKGEYSYPDWAIALGWVIAALSIVPIPIFAVIAVFNAKGTNLLEKLKRSIRSSIDECPCCGRAFNCLDEMHTHGDDCFDNHMTLVVYGPQESNVDNKTDYIAKQSSEEIACTKMNGETNT